MSGSRADDALIITIRFERFEACSPCWRGLYMDTDDDTTDDDTTDGSILNRISLHRCSQP